MPTPSSHPTHAWSRAVFDAARTPWGLRLGVVVALLGGMVLPATMLGSRWKHAERVSPLSAQVHLQRVVVEPPTTLPSHRRAAEAVGMVLAPLELRLADLPGVVPSVGSLPPAIGLNDEMVVNRADHWTVSLELEAYDDVLVVKSTVTGPKGMVGERTSAGSLQAPFGVVARVAQHVADSLAVEVPEDVAWQTPETEDPYAVLMMGRSAAVVYGLRERTEDEIPGEVLSDPVARAAYLDQRGATAQWLRARDAVARAQDERLQGAVRDVPQMSSARAIRVAEAALRGGHSAAPQRVGLAAAWGHVLAQQGRGADAWSAWKDVVARYPGDQRWTLGMIQAAIAAGDGERATAVLNALPADVRKQAGVVALEVAIADLTVEGASDALLVRWADTDPTALTPVRRRLQNRLAHGRLAEAYGLTEVLRERGAAQEADEMLVAVASELGRFGDAAAAADRLGASDVAERLRARAQLGETVDAAQDPAVARMLAESRTPMSRFARAKDLMNHGKVREASGVLDALLVRDPHWPEVLDLQMQAFTLLGKHRAAAGMRARRDEVDPLFGLHGTPALANRSAP